MSEVSRVKWLDMQILEDGRGQLTVIESSQIPFTVARFFFTTVKGENRERGGHAHRECWQLLFCITGQIDVHVVTTDGLKIYRLLQDGRSLVVPAGNWCKQIFRDADSVLGVIASHPYDSADYMYEIP